MTETIAVLGLLISVEAVALVALALAVNRQREQTKHAIQIVTTLLKAYEADTGQKVVVDHALLGDPLDVVTEDEDLFSKIPDAKPWGVR